MIKKIQIVIIAFISLSSLVVLAQSSDSFPKGRVAAEFSGEGNDPNGDGAAKNPEENESGVLFEGGAAPGTQVSVCKNCQKTRPEVNLGNSKDNAANQRDEVLTPSTQTPTGSGKTEN